MYQFYLKCSTLTIIVNIIFISTGALTTDSDVALNKCTASQSSVIGVWLFLCKDLCLWPSENDYWDER